MFCQEWIVFWMKHLWMEQFQSLEGLKCCRKLKKIETVNSAVHGGWWSDYRRNRESPLCSTSWFKKGYWVSTTPSAPLKRGKVRQKKTIDKFENYGNNRKNVTQERQEFFTCTQWKAHKDSQVQVQWDSGKFHQRPHHLQDCQPLEKRTSPAEKHMELGIRKQPRLGAQRREVSPSAKNMV